VDDREFTRIRVGRFDVGILGLKKLIEQVAAAHAGKNDEEVATFMVKELSARNYIPNGAKEEYGKAFVREFQRATGQEVTGTHHQGVDIKVLGMGCTQCNSLEQMIMGLLTELDLPASLERVADIKEIAQYGVMGTPALIINGKFVAGDNTILGNLADVVFGVFMYFPTLVEVPIAKMLLSLGMHRGPLIAYLMADPELSLQSILLTATIIGKKKAWTYVGWVALFSTISGLVYSAWVDGTSALLLGGYLAVFLLLLASALYWLHKCDRATPVVSTSESWPILP